MSGHRCMGHDCPICEKRIESREWERSTPADSYDAGLDWNYPIGWPE